MSSNHYDPESAAEFNRIASGADDLDAELITSVSSSLECLMEMQVLLPEVKPEYLLGKKFVASYDYCETVFKGIGLYAGHLVMKDISEPASEYFPEMFLLRGSVNAADATLVTDTACNAMVNKCTSSVGVVIEGSDYYYTSRNLVRDACLLQSRVRTLKEAASQEVRSAAHTEPIAGCLIGLSTVGSSALRTLFVDVEVLHSDRLRQISVLLDGSLRKILSFNLDR